jgi:hypothetical protein
VGKVVNFADYTGDMPLGEWAQFLKDQADDLIILASGHEAAPTILTKQAASDSLDRIEGLLSAARRSLNQEAS